MKIATFNANSLRKRLPIVLDWLARQKPDVLCIQETKVQDSEFPLLALAESGYEITYRGMKSYNGVAILSREKPESVAYGFDDGGDAEDARLLRVVIKGIPTINTYVPQGFEIDSPKYQYKLGWYARLQKFFDIRNDIYHRTDCHRLCTIHFDSKRSCPGKDEVRNRLSE